MYLYFEDWSQPIWLQKLDRKGLPHVGRITKVFAADQDPSVVLAKSALTIVRASDAPFASGAAYDYGLRGTYYGPRLEADLERYQFEDVGNRTVRALFRFANRHGFCQAAMAATKADRTPLIDHPFGDIDRMALAARDPRLENSMHLDIFFPPSIVALQRVVDHDDPGAMLDPSDGRAFRRTMSEATQSSC